MRKNCLIHLLLSATLSFALSSVVATRVSAANSGQTFPTPEDAVRALSRAVAETNRTALAALFGSAFERVVNPDEVQGASELAEFTEAFSQTNHLVKETDSRAGLEVGPDDWPFPIPLVKTP